MANKQQRSEWAGWYIAGCWSLLYTQQQNNGGVTIKYEDENRQPDTMAALDVTLRHQASLIRNSQTPDAIMLNTTPDWKISAAIHSEETCKWIDRSPAGAMFD